MLQLTAICMYYGQFSNYLLIHQYSTIKALVKVLIDNLTAYITYQITSLFSLDIFFDQAVLILQKNTGSTGPHFKWRVLILQLTVSGALLEGLGNFLWLAVLSGADYSTPLH